jgi:heterodisulfide reductase subunit A
MRALEFGPIEELKKKYGRSQQVIGLPSDYAPCRIACPAGVDAGGYIRLIADGKNAEALKLFRKSTPFAGVLGRVCVHPCEVECQRGKFDESISICSLKRFMADAELNKGRRKARPVKIKRSEKVAIVGSGPAGLSAAYDLIKLGYPVTVFESASEAGGMMRYGIPEYRLPKKVLNEEIDYIRELGVDIRTGSPVKSLDSLRSQGYAAVFVATGAWRSIRLNVPGEDAAGLIYAVDFLQKVNSDSKVGPSLKPAVAGKVAVIGGGSVAIDSARSALRLGAEEVHLVCLECRDLSSKDPMPAQAREIREAELEGVLIHGSQGVHRILTENGKVTGVETMACLSVRNPTGVFAPEYDQCRLGIIEADQVIAAIGQTIDAASFPELKNNGVSVALDPISLETSVKGVFAGGDLAGGTADIISAIAAGKQAAVSIDLYINGKDLIKGRHSLVRSAREKAARKSAIPTLSTDIIHSFTEVDSGLAPDIALELAGRCLQCGVTVPSVVFKPEDPKRQVIPWDAQKALALWQKRHPDNGEALPDVFTDMKDVMEVPEETYLRYSLILKPKDTKELLDHTTDDE